MKLLHVISSADPRYGGPIEGIRQVAKVLQAQGHVIEIASADDPRTPMPHSDELPLHALGPGYTHYQYAPRFIPWLRAHAPAYDAVIVNGLWQYATYATRHALHDSSTPYLVFPHGMLDPWFKRTYPLKHLKKWLFWPWSEYRVLRDAAAVLFTCEEERRLAHESFWLYRCNEVVVNYGTGVPSGTPESQRKSFFQKYPELRGKRLFLFLSRIHKKKGCDLLIEAFARVAHADSGMQLVMAGPDQTGWQGTLEALARRLGVGKQVTWTGMLQGDRKWGAYHSAEAFILPSHQENFGIVVAEAMACGLPVLISDKVNIWREIHSANAGFVAQDTRAGTLSLFERWLALDEQRRKQMRTNARDCFQRHFAIDAAAHSQYQAIVSSIAASAVKPIPA